MVTPAYSYLADRIGRAVCVFAKGRLVGVFVLQLRLVGVFVVHFIAGFRREIDRIWREIGGIGRS